jgi:hypothetical protein
MISPTDIDEWYSEYVEKWMFNDIQKAIKNDCNYLAALGIALYSDALIRMIHPTMLTGQRYDIFVRDYLGPEYEKVDNLMRTIQVNGPSGPERGSIYNIIRNGLAHEYWIKGEGYIFQKPASEIKCGIIFDPIEKKTIIILDKYFQDFKTAARKIHDKLIEERSNARQGYVIIGEPVVGHSGSWYYLLGETLFAKKPENRD